MPLIQLLHRARTSFGLGGCDRHQIEHIFVAAGEYNTSYLPAAQSPFNNMSSSTDYSGSYASIASLGTDMRSTRSKTATSAASSTSNATLSSQHPYLGNGKVSSIESWTASIPTKRAHGIPEDIDPVVQAYLETKMALFRNAASSNPMQTMSSSRKQQP